MRLCLFYVNALTSSTATRLGKFMNDVRKHVEIWWRFDGGTGGDSAVAAELTRAAERKEGGRRGRGPAASKLTFLLAATLGYFGGVAACLIDSGGLGVALPCASTRRSRILANLFDGCSCVGRRLSPREMARIIEMNESVFSLSFLETGGIGLSESREKVVCSILSTDLASPTLRLLHIVISDFRPPSVAESGEAAFRRLFTSRAIGGYSLASDDPALGSPTVFQSSRVARPQDAPKAPLPCVVVE